ncbi:MAG: YihY/virulence factor BrkB family protein [Candidatus Limnocylindrales bacterium]
MREIVRAYVKRVIDDDVAGVSAELAFRFMFATFPFAIFVVALGGFVASWLGIRDPSNRIIGALGGDLPSDLIGPITSQLQAALVHTHPELLSVGAAVTLYGAVTGMNSLMKAMNRAYGVRETRPLALRLVMASVLTVLGGIAAALSFGAIVGGTLITRRFVDHAGLREVWPWISLVRWPVSFALLVIAVTAVLRFAPVFRTPWRVAALAATAFAAVWLVVTYAFGVYVAQFASYAATYGALAGVIVLMLWFYLTAFVLVCAAELGALLVRLRSPQLLVRGG